MQGTRPGYYRGFFIPCSPQPRDAYDGPNTAMIGGLHLPGYLMR
jgi:hypothetical protein